MYNIGLYILLYNIKIAKPRKKPITYIQIATDTYIKIINASISSGLLINHNI